jgi:hypothetical protein
MRERKGQLHHWKAHWAEEQANRSTEEGQDRSREREEIVGNRIKKSMKGITVRYEIP